MGLNYKSEIWHFQLFSIKGTIQENKYQKHLDADIF